MSAKAGFAAHGLSLIPTARFDEPPSVRCSLQSEMIYSLTDQYVVPFPNTSRAKWVVSTGGGARPLWSHSGNELFYRDGAGNLVAVQVKTKPTFAVGRRTVLFPAAAYASAF